MIIAIDFDGTIVKHDYPRIGEPVPGAIECMLDLQAAGHKLILYTMRSDASLDEAVEYCAHQDIEFYGVNKNPTQKVWTNSPKAYAKLYIDDTALGCPIINPGNGERRYVDWGRVRQMLQDQGILPYERDSSK